MTLLLNVLDAAEQRAAAAAALDIVESAPRSTSGCSTGRGCCRCAMAGLERVSCSTPAVVCVYRRPLVASSIRAEAGTVKARARTVWDPFC